MIWVIDFETYRDREYSVKKLTLEAYIRDSRFEALCCRVRDYETGELVASLRGPEEIESWVAAQDWSDITAICHHAHFDCGILSFIYHAIPRLIICTLSMARALYGPAAKVSLEACAERLGLAPKILDYNLFTDRHWADLDDDLIDHLLDGCDRDVELTLALAKDFLPRFPKPELVIIDSTVRMFTEPLFQGDAERFMLLAEQEFWRKNDALDALAVTEKQLHSSAQLAELLRACGETIPYKRGKSGMVPCFALTDEYMQTLIARDDRAGRLARARLDIKSTIEETRAWQLAQASLRGRLPIYLVYCGAATTRWSGGELNPQNLPSGEGLRECFMAPAGHKLVIADFAQIELRILCALAGQNDKLDQLRRGKDIYKLFAARLFDKGPDTVTPDERYFAKTATLGLGYGMGQDKFIRLCQARQIAIEEEVIREAVRLYRQVEYPCVAAFWRICDGYLTELAEGRAVKILDFLWLLDRHVCLPNGLACPFDVRLDAGQYGFVRTTRNGESTYWGGAFTEFLCQSLARVCLSDVMLAMMSELHARPALLVHDELVYVARDDMAEAVLSWLLQFMSESPIWWLHGPPLKAEGRIADAYG